MGPQQYSGPAQQYHAPTQYTGPGGDMMSKIHALWSEVDKRFVSDENTTQENSTDKPKKTNQHPPKVQSAKNNSKKENVHEDKTTAPALKKAKNNEKKENVK